MNILRNDRGVALITALLLTMIALAIVLAAFYFISQQTQLSASGKRYKTSLEAAHGGVDVFTKELIPKLFNGYSSSKLQTDFSNIDLIVRTDGACMTQKLNMATSAWTSCGSSSSSLDAKISPDITFNLKGMPLRPAFNVYSKIVDTVPGNSDLSGFDLLDSGSGVTGGAAGVAPKHLPAVYRIEVQGEKQNNPKEKARLSVLYAY